MWAARLMLSESENPPSERNRILLTSFVTVAFKAQVLGYPMETMAITGLLTSHWGIGESKKWNIY